MVLHAVPCKSNKNRFLLYIGKGSRSNVILIFLSILYSFIKKEGKEHKKFRSNRLIYGKTNIIMVVIERMLKREVRMENKDQNNGGNRGNNNKKLPRSGWIVCLIAALLMVVFFSYMSKQMDAAATKEVTYTEFQQMIANRRVEQVKLDYDKGKILIYPAKQYQQSYGITYYTGMVDDPGLIERLTEAGITVSSPYVDKSTTIVDILLAYVLPFVIIYVIMFFLFRMLTKGGGGMMGGVGKSNAKIYVEKETGVTFKDVAGQEEAKESLTELVDFLHNPGKYTRIGAKLPKGALLVGPPGTGKTLLAKAVAGEAKVPFFSLAGSDFVEMFVGVGASRVRDLFKQAQSQAPCIVFIDEIDAIGKSRDSHYGGNDEREQTLNQLLSEMDGFDTSKGIVILAATNRPEVLDKALLRPGRFDRQIIVDRPDLKGRIDILRVHSRNVLMHESVDLEAVALATSGAVGSDLANIINEAAILAVKEGRTVVTQADLMESIDTVVAGKEKKDRILGPKEKKIVAYHEVGHALVTALDKKSEPVQKITIVPRTKGSLGHVLHAPEEEKFSNSKEELLARIAILLGGRAAEELVFHSVTDGAASDIQQATSIARAMVTQCGMSEKFGLIALESIENRYLDGRPVMNCADATAAEIDREVMSILKECYAKSYQMLSENRQVLDEIAEYLIQKESITGKEFMKIYREVKGITEEPSSDLSDQKSEQKVLLETEIHSEKELSEPETKEEKNLKI